MSLDEIAGRRVASLYLACYPKPRTVEDLLEMCRMQATNIARERDRNPDLFDWRPGVKNNPGMIQARAEPIMEAVRDRLKAKRMDLSHTEAERLLGYLESPLRQAVDWGIQGESGKRILRDVSPDVAEYLVNLLGLLALSRNTAQGMDNLWAAALEMGREMVENFPPDDVWPRLPPELLGKLIEIADNPAIRYFRAQMEHLPHAVSILMDKMED